MGRSQSTYRTSDLSIAAHLYAQGARLKSIADREFFFDTNGDDAVAMAIGYIGSDSAAYDQSIRALKKIMLEWTRRGLVGEEGQFSIDGRMELVAYLCQRGARLVGFERLQGSRKRYRAHFDADPEMCDGIIESWGESSASRFDAATRELKRLAKRGRDGHPWQR